LGRVQNEAATYLFEGSLFFQNLSTGPELLRIPVLGQKLEGEAPKFGDPFSCPSFMAGLPIL